MSPITTVFTATFALTGVSSLLAAVVAKAALNRLNNSDRDEPPTSFPSCDFYALNPNLQSNLAAEAMHSQTGMTNSNYNWAKSSLGITNQQNIISIPNGWTIQKDADLNILRVYRSKRKD